MLQAARRKFAFPAGLLLMGISLARSIAGFHNQLLSWWGLATLLGILLTLAGSLSGRTNR
jgi:hypothetical protein